MNGRAAKAILGCLNNQSANFRRTLFTRFKNRNKDTGNYQIVRPGVVSAAQPVPDHIEKPSYYFNYVPPCDTTGNPELKTDGKIRAIRESCEIAARILEKCSEILAPGLVTEEIDKFVHEETIKANAYPSPLNYAAFPKSVCTSVNNVVCHGIPDDRPLVNGDIINIDITVFYKGFHGDCSKTFLVGDVDEQARFLVQITEECLYKAIALCGPNVPFNKIGECIENHANSNGLKVIPEFIGHGIGSYFHGPPEICHYRNDFPGHMMSGMTFTIEPILTLGEPGIQILEDEWTAVTKDNARTAQFEHTILITKRGCEILTMCSE